MKRKWMCLKGGNSEEVYGNTKSLALIEFLNKNSAI
jgi:hypothetical protein